MTAETRWTYALLAASALLICLSGYMLLSQAQRLKAFQNSLQSTELELARKQAQLLVVSDALRTNVDAAAMRDQGSKVAAQVCSRGDTTARERLLCAIVRSNSGAFARFLAAYAGVTAQRAAADDPADFATVRSAYEALRPQLSREVDPGRQWAARVEEGIAYSDYRAGNLDLAEQEANRAWTLDDRSAFVGLTRLKIACATRQPAERIRELHAAQRRLLEESIRNPRAGMDPTYARLELGYYSSDPELELACSYAKLAKT